MLYIENSMAEVSHKTLCHRASDTVDAAAACLGLLHQANRTFGLRPIALRVQGDKIPSLYFNVAVNQAAAVICLVVGHLKERANR